MMLDLMALILAAVFTGAALLVSIAEQPARLALDDAQMLIEWRRSYARAAPMQGGLALVTGVLGMAAWWTSNGMEPLAGSLLILACWPFVLFVVMPVNRQLQGIDASQGTKARELVVRWGRLHAVRTLLGAAATVCFALPLLQL